MTTQPTSEMIEAVARAIHADRNEWRNPMLRRPWEEATEADKATARSFAKAAIDAMDKFKEKS